jgi:riboflavin kinase
MSTTMDWTHLYCNERVFSEAIVLNAEVVHGFKRGSKELGIPTANLNMEELGAQGEALETGIYYGWSILKGTRYETVVSVGWNPFYKNEKKTIEAHLIYNLEDFYGEKLTIELVGYLRQEANFNGVGEFTLLSILYLVQFINILIFHLHFHYRYRGAYLLH